MNKPYSLVLATGITLILIIGSLASAEEITMTTYYPAPFGSYIEMDVYYLDFKNDLYDEDAGNTPDEEEARIFYDSAAAVDKFKYHNGTDWKPFGKSFWKLSPNSPPNQTDIYYDDGYVGIGIDEPPAALTVNGGILNATPSPETGNFSVMYGTNAHTHVNLGVESTTGTDGQNYSYCTIGGGYQNNATREGATIGGGAYNDVTGAYATVGGGGKNDAINDYATIMGGYNNEASGDYASIGGGCYNTASRPYSVIAGGNYNTASGEASTILGGAYSNAGGDFSCAGGYEAEANDDGSFVWAANPVPWVPDPYPSNGLDTFNIRADGGVYYGTALVGDAPAPPPSWDLAEEMVVHKADNLQEAELVSLSGNDILAKTKVAYDENLIGVVTGSRTTTMHFQSIGEPEDLKLEEKYITLVGRVYVKVNNENGPIKVGSPITSSSVPGIGMQATRPAKIIGYAMIEANFTTTDTEEVLVFANVGYYVPERAFSELSKEISELEQQMLQLSEVEQ